MSFRKVDREYSGSDGRASPPTSLFKALEYFGNSETSYR